MNASQQLQQPIYHSAAGCADYAAAGSTPSTNSSAAHHDDAIMHDDSKENVMAEGDTTVGGTGTPYG